MSERFPFPRSQKFKLSAKGEEAVASYAQVIADARTGTGQVAFEAARAKWAEPWAIAPDDATVLTEYGTVGKTVVQAATALQDCGNTLDQVKDKTTLLVKNGLLIAELRTT